MKDHVRLHPYDPKAGRVLRDYTVRGVRFVAGAWRRVTDPALLEHLETVRQEPLNDRSPLAFDVMTKSEAVGLDRREAAARRGAPPASRAEAATPRPSASEPDGTAEDAAPAQPRPSASPDAASDPVTSEAAPSDGGRGGRRGRGKKDRG